MILFASKMIMDELNPVRDRKPLVSVLLSGSVESSIFSNNNNCQ